MIFSSCILIWKSYQGHFLDHRHFFFFVTNGKREVSSANNLTLDFNASRNSLIYIKKTKVPKWILEELPQVQVASLNT